MAEVEAKSSEIIESKEKEISEAEDENLDESKENDENKDDKPKTPKSARTPLKTIPLFDSPLTQSGKRVRAQAQQYVVEKKEEFVYEFNGSGVALGEIPYIEFMITRELSENLKKLHTVCFSRTGDRNIVKKNLRQFNGYKFGSTDAKFESRKTAMDRYYTQDLKHLCKILGLEVNGAKVDIISRILDFVSKPVDHQKKLPEKKKKKSGGKKKKSDKGKKKAPRKSKGGDTENDSTANDENDSTANDENDSTANDENDSTADDTADSSGSGSDGSESEAEEKPKKTPAKKPVKTLAKKVAAKNTPAKKTPAKKTPAKKAPAKKTPAKKEPAKRSKEVVDSDSDSSDDEPLIKKTKTVPSNDEIKKKVEKILDGADLGEVTMKGVCKEVYAMYPDFDLTDRKSFIKETVKAVLG